MEFEIINNEHWERGGLYILLADGEPVMESDDKNILRRYAGLLIEGQKQ